MSRLEHVGIAVRNADTTTRLYDLLLYLLPYKVEEVVTESVLTYFVDAGGTKLEFLESNNPDSAIGRYLQAHGPGLHHLAFEVDDLEETVRRATQTGIRVIGDRVTAGADGKEIVFLHPKDTHGVLIELCRTVRPVWRKVMLRTGGRDVTYFTAGAAGNPILLIVNSQFQSGLGQMVPRLESGFHIIGIESANDLSVLPKIIGNETQHASDQIYLLTTQHQAPGVVEALRHLQAPRLISGSMVVCSGSAAIADFAELPNLLVASTEQLALPPAFQHIPVAVLPHPISSIESTFLDWLHLILNGVFRPLPFES